VVVVGDQRPVVRRDAVDLHQVAQAAGILGRDHIGPGQQVERAQRDVARRADRRGDQVEPRFDRFRARLPDAAHAAGPPLKVYFASGSA